MVGADVSSDGKRLLTSASDGTARIWDLTTDQPSTLAVLSAADGSVGYGFFLADNRTVVTVNNGRTRLWDTDATAVATRICALAGHDITADEWRQHFDDLVPHRPPCAR